MYDTDYFVRFVANAAQARRDLRRGYSFSSYAFFPTKAEAREFWHDLGVSEPALGRCREGWGLKLDGLCGFGPFESVEEAEAFARDRQGYNDVEYPAAAVYAGRWLSQADGGDGDVFRADRLVKVIQF